MLRAHRNSHSNYDGLLFLLLVLKSLQFNYDEIMCVK